MHVCHVGTQQAIQGAYAIYGTWRKTALALKYPANFATILNQIAKGKGGAISPAKEDELRQRLGFSILYGISVPPCTDCGSVHHTRCHGNSGPVIVLAENQRVVEEKPKSAPKGRKRFRPDMTETQYNRWLAMSKEERVEVMGE